MLTKTKLMTNANEERDELVEDVTEDETYEADTTTEDDGDATEESETAETSEETVTISKSDYDKIRREAAAAARLRGKGKESGKENSRESTQSYDQDLIARTFLAAQAGINDPEVQDEALRLAKKFDMPIDQAMKDADIEMRVKNLQKQQQAKAGIAGGNGAGGVKSRSVEQYTNEFRKTGKLPDDPRLVSKILDELTKKK
jgi:hypothetical protein